MKFITKEEKRFCKLVMRRAKLDLIKLFIFGKLKSVSESVYLSIDNLKNQGNKEMGIEYKKRNVYITISIVNNEDILERIENEKARGK